MHTLHPELTRALSEMLDRMDSMLKSGGYEGDPVEMYLAGGMAVHYYCGSRYTEDVDATFSRRMLLQYDQLVVSYIRASGRPSHIYLDPTYNDTFALLHPDHRADSMAWEEIGNERRLIRLRVLSPIDLAVSKLSRFAEVDQGDILELARQGCFGTAELKQRALEAIEYYVGETRWIHLNLSQICEAIDSPASH